MTQDTSTWLVLNALAHRLPRGTALRGMMVAMVYAVGQRTMAVYEEVPCRLRGARLDALMATWLVPPALAVALEATLPT